MKKTGQNFFHITFSVALAAVIAAAAAGCSGNNGPHTSAAPSDAPQATTVTATIPFPSSGESVESGKADDSDEKDSNTLAAAASGATAAETAENADSDRTVAAADAADTSSTDSETAVAGDTSSDSDLSTTADAADADTTGTGAEYAEDFVAAAIEDGVPERSEPDTSLKESDLSEALVECTGWGQSAGSSLHAASSAVQLLLWANQVEAGSVDSDLLKETVAAEVKRLSDSQQENLKVNWSSISYDASLVLDDFQEISPMLEDAGCSAAAKEASENKDSVKNWEALEHALNAALK